VKSSATSCGARSATIGAGSLIRRERHQRSNANESVVLAGCL
jgi:hypothetical protein